MPQNTKELIKELSRYSRIQDLPDRWENYTLQILDEIDEYQREHPSGIPAEFLKLRVCKKGGMGNKTYYACKSWLEKREFILIKQPSKQNVWHAKQPRKIIIVTTKGHEVINLSKQVGKLREEARRFYTTKDYSQKLTSIKEIFKTIFTVAYEEFNEKGKYSEYIEFLKNIENPIQEYLNKNITEELEDIKKGKDRGKFFDPYFSIEQTWLFALYYDAKLAHKMHHFLTSNHIFILTKAKEYTEEELIEHNKEWSRRFEEDEVEGEEDFNAHIWRLNPALFVFHEREIRKSQPLPEELLQVPKVIPGIKCPKCGGELSLPGTLKLAEGTILHNVITCMSCSYYTLEYDKDKVKNAIKSEIEKQTYGTRFRAFYDKLRERTYSHNGFQHDARWPIDIDKTTLIFRMRELERKAKKYGIEAKDMSKLRKMIGKSRDEWGQQPDDSFKVNFYDLQTGELIKTISVKKVSENTNS